MRVICSLLILMLAITGCAGEEPTPTPNPPLTPLDSPLTQPAVMDSPISTPAVVDVPIPIPSPQAGMGTVTGNLTTAQEGAISESTFPVLLYLASLIYSDDGESSMAKLDKESAPMTVPDEAGHFVFLDVEPGTYALIYSTVTSEVPLKAPGSGEDLTITVIADQTIDLGGLTIEMP